MTDSVKPLTRETLRLLDRDKPARGAVITVTTDLYCDLLATAKAGLSDTELVTEVRAILKHGYSTQDFAKAVTYAASRIDAARRNTGPESSGRGASDE